MRSKRFRQLIIIKNSHSTKAQASQQYIDAIRKTYPDVPCITLTLDDSLPTKLADQINDDTLICILGGDGSVNSIVQILLEDPKFSTIQHKTPILPLWCGNANDIATMLNGRASVTKCRTILQHGNTVPIYPLRCELRAQGATTAEVHLAFGYLSFGVSAHTAKRLNDPAFRSNPLHVVPGIKPVNEVLLLLSAMQSSPSFTVEQNGEQKIVYDWIIGKGSRMAKNVKLPVQLTDRSYYQSVVRKNLSEVALRLGGMAWGTLEPTPETDPITFTTQEPIWAQFDGEPMPVDTGTKVTVSLNGEPIYALSTTLPKPATLKA